MSMFTCAAPCRRRCRLGRHADGNADGAPCRRRCRCGRHAVDDADGGAVPSAMPMGASRCSRGDSGSWRQGGERLQALDFYEGKAKAVVGALTCLPRHRRRLYIGSTSASPTACLLRGYWRAGTQNDRLDKEVIFGTGTPIPAQ